MAAAMRHQSVDRVPVMCQLSLGHYFLNTAIPAVDIWHTNEGFGQALITLQREYQFDGVLINLPGRDPQWRSYLRRMESRGDKKILHWENGWITVCPGDDNPHNYRADGREYHPEFAEIDPERLFYVEPHDLGGLKYPFAWGFAGESSRSERDFPPWYFDTIDYIVRHAGQELSVHGEIFSPFSQFLELLGCSRALPALLRDPGKSKACLQALVGGSIALGCGLAAHGADAILISSAYAGGGFISTHHYREFVLPYERCVIQGLKAAHDLPIYTHTCGKIGDRLELLAETGTDGIDTLDPPPLGTVELADAKRRIGQKLFIKGNMDPVNVIMKGTPGQVYEDALRCIAAAAPGGGYILSSACSIPPYAPPENVKMIAAAACAQPSDNLCSFFS